MHILDQEAPGMANSFRSLNLRKRRRLLAKACAISADLIGDLGSEVEDLLKTISDQNELSDTEVSKVKSLAESADEQYFLLQEQDVPETALLRSFGKARLLTAIADGFGGESWEVTSDAVYELCKSVADPSPILAAIRAELGTE